MRWYFVEKGKAIGPLDLAQMRAMGATAHLRPSSQVCRVGESEWIDARDDEALRGLFVAPATVDPLGGSATKTLSIGKTSAPPEFSFGAAFALAIDTFKKNWAMLLLVSLAYTAIMAALATPAIVSNIAAKSSGGSASVSDLLGGCVLALLQILVGTPLTAGIGYCGAQAIEEKLQLSDLFVGFRRWRATFYTSLSSEVLFYVVLVFTLIPMYVWIESVRPTRSAVAVLILLGIAGYAAAMAIVGVRLLGAATIACDPARESMGVMDTLKASWNGSQGKVVPLFCFSFVVALAVLASAFMLCLPFLVLGMPFAIAARGAMYSMLYRRSVASTPALP